MNCWKTIRITQDYGALRLVFYSACTMLFSFLLYYLAVSSFVEPSQLTNISLFLFILSIPVLVLTHKVLHMIPIWLCGKRVLLKVERLSLIPTLAVKMAKPLSRDLFLISLLMPLIVLTAVGAVAAIAFPTYIAYISIMSSIHFGLAFFDVIYVSYLMKAPKNSYVENRADGFHILVKQAA
ncbi:DUF3267 domain-containing protein [Halalkalibacter oceani]|uniref:DUF3267 domain-containing protein n=1 Tax=Halalkalibacter oceani TaxID=1653776 RepID=A0A9X2DLG7_9BACI|nr:DUF3267 domain-containing protein [Halalkalibacter oceani]MCM3712636.1 DUF3267 domain-containing protein [Halalkalibacter oceani]